MVELMVSLALGLLVVLATTGLLLSARTTYLAQDDEVQLQDNARYALDVITRAVRQASYEHRDIDGAHLLHADLSPSIVGLDARRLKTNTPGIEGHFGPAVNGSDVLALRFFGSGPGPDGDSTMLNCAGFSVPAPTGPEAADQERGWSVFYVGQASSGELELYCKYRGKSAWSAQSIARGVESFQVLYGLDQDGDGLPDQYMSAERVQQRDDALSAAGNNAAHDPGAQNRRSHWKKVVAIRVALLMRGNQVHRSDSADLVFDLFGPDYSVGHAQGDTGVRIEETALPVATRRRLRRVFDASIQLRNAAAGSAA